jgi:hypothetical protein
VTGYSGVNFIIIALLLFLSVVALKTNFGHLSWEVIIVFTAFTLALRFVFTQDLLRILYILVPCIPIALTLLRTPIAYAQNIRQYRHYWRSDYSWGLLFLTAPFLFISRQYPSIQYSWLLLGDGSNWFTVNRINQVAGGQRFLADYFHSLGTVFSIDLLIPSKGNAIQTQFLNEIQAMLNLQVVTTWLICCILVNYFQSSQVNAYTRLISLLAFTQSGTILGLVGKNGFISVSLSILLLILCWKIIFLKFGKRPFYEFIVYASLTFLVMATYSLLVPLVMFQYVYLKLKKIEKFRISKFESRVYLGILSIGFIVIGSQLLKLLDRNYVLTIPRGGIWELFSPMPSLILICFMFSILKLLGSENVGLWIGQLVVLLLTCQILFSTYPDPKLFGPWTSYYPQKILVIFVISSFLICYVEIISRARSLILHFALILTLFFNLNLDIPSPIGSFSIAAIGKGDLGAIQKESSEVLDFVISAPDKKTPFAFWHYFNWPAEGSANAWAGLMWERYPGNYSMPVDDPLWKHTYSGPVGNRVWHNGNPEDSTNLCRLVELMPNGSIVFTRNSEELLQEYIKCRRPITFKVQSTKR